MKPDSSNALSIIAGDLEADTPTSWTSALLELHYVNSRLWNLEEAVRRNSSDDSVVAALKHEIDVSNMSRHRAVAELDRRLSGLLVSEAKPDAEVVLNSETMGQMLDRLSVLMLKRKNFTIRMDNASLEKINLHIRHICVCFDNTVHLVSEGALPPGLNELKDYGDS